MTRKQAEIIVEALAGRYGRCQNDIEAAFVQETIAELLSNLPIEVVELLNEVAKDMEIEDLELN